MGFRGLIGLLSGKQPRRLICADCRKPIQTAIFNHGDGRLICRKCEVKRGQAEYAAHPEDFLPLPEEED